MVQIIEVGGINRGVPDLYCCKEGVEHWIELKNSHYSDFERQWHIDFRPGQQAWLRRNAVHGGQPFVIEAGLTQYAVHKYSKVIKDDVLLDGYDIVNGFEKIDWLLMGGIR
jgi:hypothetical protein